MRTLPSPMFSNPARAITVMFMILAIWDHALMVMGQSPPSNQTTARRLRIAVPVSTVKEFISISKDPTTGEQRFSGFSVDIFKAVVNTALTTPFDFDFIPFTKPDGSMNGSYDDLLKSVFSKDYDGAVGDVTIRFYRTQWVDFTLPYSETGVTMMVPTKPLQQNSTKIKVMPLIKALVSATLGFCFISAFIFWFVEYRNDRRKLSSQKTSNSNPQEQPSATDENWRRETLRAIIHTRLLMVMWFLVLLFLSSCYTASITSMLTSQRKLAPVTSLTELIRKGSPVGCADGSFVVDLLKERGFSERQILTYETEQDMADLLSNGKVAAIVDEAPYLRVFLSKNCKKPYVLVPSINLHADGFGYAFPKGSPLVSQISNGILKVMDGGQLATIQEKTIGDMETCQSDSSSDGDSNVLDFDTMWILLAGAIGVTILVIVLYLVYFGTACDNVRKRVAYPCYIVSNTESNHGRRGVEQTH